MPPIVHLISNPLLNIHHPDRFWVLGNVTDIATGKQTLQYVSADSMVGGYKVVSDITQMQQRLVVSATEFERFKKLHPGVVEPVNIPLGPDIVITLTLYKHFLELHPLDAYLTISDFNEWIPLSKFQNILVDKAFWDKFYATDDTTSNLPQPNIPHAGLLLIGTTNIVAVEFINVTPDQKHYTMCDPNW